MIRWSWTQGVTIPTPVFFGVKRVCISFLPLENRIYSFLLLINNQTSIPLRFGWRLRNMIWRGGRQSRGCDHFCEDELPPDLSATHANKYVDRKTARTYMHTDWGDPHFLGIHFPDLITRCCLSASLESGVDQVPGGHPRLSQRSCNNPYMGAKYSKSPN